MTPIEHRVDVAFLQALNCAEHRVPRDVRLQPSAFALVWGIRYGLLGAAATHALFATTEEPEISAVRSATKDWERLVDSHLRLTLMRHPGPGLDREQVAKYSDQTFHEYLAGYFRGCSLSACLEGVVRVMGSRHRAEIIHGWPWCRRIGAHRIFGASNAESIRFALLFFDRRSADLEELPEIALLGE